MDGCLLVFASLLLVGGTLGDRFGRRRALFLGMMIFGAGSVLASFSGSAHELIAAGALMGVGAAGDVVGVALSIVALTSVVWGLSEASSRGWTDPSILGGFALGGVVLAAFLAGERRVAQPMIDTRSSAISGSTPRACR